MERVTFLKMLLTLGVSNVVNLSLSLHGQFTVYESI